jgi:Na+/proline symporter
MAQFALFLMLGIGLWGLYGEGAFERTDEVFAAFVVESLPPGVTGLLVAGVFAAAMSTLSSSINSLASATAYDFWAPAAGVADDARILRAGRAFSALWTVALVGAALAFVPLSRGTAAVEVALAAASLVYGGLLGAFVLALGVPRARQEDAIPAMAAGVAVVAGVWAFASGAVAWPWYVPLGAAVTTATGWALSLRAPLPAGRTPR